MGAVSLAFTGLGLLGEVRSTDENGRYGMAGKRRTAALTGALPVAGKLVQKVTGKLRRKPKSRWELLVERANKTLRRSR